MWVSQRVVGYCTPVGSILYGYSRLYVGELRRALAGTAFCELRIPGEAEYTQITPYRRRSEIYIINAQLTMIEINALHPRAVWQGLARRKA